MIPEEISSKLKDFLGFHSWCPSAVFVDFVTPGRNLLRDILAFFFRHLLACGLRSRPVLIAGGLISRLFTNLLVFGSTCFLIFGLTFLLILGLVLSLIDGLTLLLIFGLVFGLAFFIVLGLALLFVLRLILGLTLFLVLGLTLLLWTKKVD